MRLPGTKSYPQGFPFTPVVGVGVGVAVGIGVGVAVGVGVGVAVGLANAVCVSVGVDGWFAIGVGVMPTYGVIIVPAAICIGIRVGKIDGVDPTLPPSVGIPTESIPPLAAVILLSLGSELAYTKNRHNATSMPAIKANKGRRTDLPARRHPLASPLDGTERPCA